MVDFRINTGIRKIGDLLTVAIPFAIDAEWIPEDLIVVLSRDDVLATLVIDFAYDVPTIVEYTVNGGTDWIAFNEGVELSGGQSRFIEVNNGVQVNFRAKTAGNLVRCIVSSVP